MPFLLFSKLCRNYAEKKQQVDKKCIFVFVLTCNEN